MFLYEFDAVGLLVGLFVTGDNVALTVKTVLQGSNAPCTLSARVLTTFTSPCQNIPLKLAEYFVTGRRNRICRPTGLNSRRVLASGIDMEDLGMVINEVGDKVSLAQPSI